LSIGTGHAEVISIRKPGFFQQIVPTDVIDALKAISTDCETTHEDTCSCGPLLHMAIRVFPFLLF
jgi:hypothetical protein